MERLAELEDEIAKGRKELEGTAGMKWPVETIDVVAQVNPKLAAADRPDLDEIVCFVPIKTRSVRRNTEYRLKPIDRSPKLKGVQPFKRR